MQRSPIRKIAQALGAHKGAIEAPLVSLKGENSEKINKSNEEKHGKGELIMIRPELNGEMSVDSLGE